MLTRSKSQNGVDHSQPKPFSGPSRGKTLNRRKNNGKAVIIVIDIDDDDDDDGDGDNVQREHKDGPLQGKAGGDVGTVRNCLINNREKHKETDEYKRAAEAEWASRQQALRQQAEEAQKMRQVLKRKKAESLSLEKRQKQRVEEIRETQKKKEENMNMKEALRAEVRMELKQLELKCLDMGSLLRALGIHVSGGTLPQPHDIRVAYKKACLSFHPDRAPTADIRKMVEAEEKFKLMCRMKEKFLATS